MSNRWIEMENENAVNLSESGFGPALKDGFENGASRFWLSEQQESNS